MTETPETPSMHFSILVESAPGSNTFNLREPYEGTPETVRVYAHRIADAEGRNVKIATGDGQTDEIIEPSSQEHD